MRGMIVLESIRSIVFCLFSKGFPGDSSGSVRYVPFTTLSFGVTLGSNWGSIAVNIIPLGLSFSLEINPSYRKRGATS